MPGATVNIGTGTTITFATTGFSAEIVETINWANIARPAVDTTHMLSTQPTSGTFGGRTFIPPKFADPGEITLQVHHNPQLNVPINSAPEVITVTFPLVTGDATAAYWSGTGFITSMGIAIPLEDKMQNTITVKMSGLITYYDAT